MREDARVASKGWGRADVVRALRAGPTAAASARLPTWKAPPSSCAALDNCNEQYVNIKRMFQFVVMACTQKCVTSFVGPMLGIFCAKSMVSQIVIK